MHSQPIQFAQNSNGITRMARISLPNCGRMTGEEPIIIIEIDTDGNMTMKVYADILYPNPTHEIPLNGARLELKHG